MIWPWARKERKALEEGSMSASATSYDEARAAGRGSAAALDAARERDPHIRRVAHTFRSVRPDRFASEVAMTFREHKA